MGDCADFDCFEAPLYPCTYPLSAMMAGVIPHLVEILISSSANTSAVTHFASIGTPMICLRAYANALSMMLKNYS